MADITATSPPKAQLPSIKEMFPDHLANLAVLSSSSSASSSGLPAPASKPLTSSVSSSPTVTATATAGRPAGRMHICPMCHKWFNRSSSLRMHMDTHVGGTPFRCPWPNCGREFNVQSNMRRHLRTHGAPGPGAKAPSSYHYFSHHTVDAPQQRYDHLRREGSASNRAKVTYHGDLSGNTMEMHHS